MNISIRILVFIRIFTLVFLCHEGLTVDVIAEPIDLVLKGTDGHEHYLSKYIGNGRWTVINVWSPTCTPCRDEMPILNRFHIEHRDKNAEVLGLAIGFPDFDYGRIDLVAEFIKQEEISFPNLLVDRNMASQVGEKYLQAIPTTYFFRPDGKLVARWPGTVSKVELEEFIDTYTPDINDWLTIP